MTNPNNAIGTNGAYSGRTSVNAFNDNLAIYTGRGILSGWATAPSSGLTVTLGGDSSTRDVAIAEDNAGNKTTINNISGSPVSVTISAAPTTNSRIDLIVAYVDNPPQGSSDKVDNYEACGLIVVEGTVAASPSAPSEADIRSAITADGATGSTAYYVILSSITITSGTTDITSNMISAGGSAMIKSSSNYGVQYGAASNVGGSVYTEITPAVGGGFFEVEAITGYVWGYAGGALRLETNVPTGLTTSSYVNGAITGGDGVGRQMQSHRILKGAAAGTKYRFTATISGSGIGITPELGIWVKYFPPTN